MKKLINALLHYLVVGSLCLSCAAALAVPKAAENEDEAVTFGEAGSPPKPTAKHAPPAAAKTSSVPRQPAGKQAKHAGSKRSPAVKASKHGASKGSKPAAATKPSGSAKPKGASPAKTPKAPPARTAPEKNRGTTQKK